MEGAVVCMGKDTLTNSMIHVTNLSVDTEKNTLTLQLKPSEFYEGNLRNALSGEVVTLNEQITSSALNTGIHLEAAVTSPENIARLPIIPRTRPCLIPLEEGQSCPEWARPPA